MAGRALVAAVLLLAGVLASGAPLAVRQPLTDAAYVASSLALLVCSWRAAERARGRTRRGWQLMAVDGCAAGRSATSSGPGCSSSRGRSPSRRSPTCSTWPPCRRSSRRSCTCTSCRTSLAGRVRHGLRRRCSSRSACSSSAGRPSCTRCGWAGTGSTLNQVVVLAYPVADVLLAVARARAGRRQPAGLRRLPARGRRAAAVLRRRHQPRAVDAARHLRHGHDAGRGVGGGVPDAGLGGGDLGAAARRPAERPRCWARRRRTSPSSPPSSPPPRWCSLTPQSDPTGCVARASAALVVATALRQARRPARERGAARRARAPRRGPHRASSRRAGRSSSTSPTTTRSPGWSTAPCCTTGCGRP